MPQAPIRFQTYPLTGPATPTPRWVGDLWYCTVSSGSFVAGQVYKHNGTTWVLLQAGGGNIASGTGNADYTTTSASFVDVDGTHMAATLTTLGGDVLLLWSGAISISQVTSANFTFTRDGTNLGPAAGLTGVSETANNAVIPVSIVWRDPAPTAGAHTYKLQWVTGAGTLTLYGSTFRTQIIAQEVH